MLQNKLAALHWAAIILTLIFLIVPVIGTLLYSLTDHWTTTFLPEDYTFSHYRILFADPRFWTAYKHSCAVIAATLAIAMIIIIPAVFVVYFALPQLKPIMETLILLPFAVPPVVAAVGLLNIFSNSPIQILNTPYILWGTYFVIAVPFVYRSLANSLEAIPINDLIDAARLLGASTARAFFSVILLGLRKGVLIAICLCFSMLLGKFVFANLLAGSNYETLQIYLNLKRWENTHTASAIVISYFIATLIFTLLALHLSKDKRKTAN